MAEPASQRRSPARQLGRLGNILLTGAGPGDPAADIEAPSIESGREPEFAALLRTACRERVTGLLAHAVAEGVLVVDDDQHDRVAEAHRDAMAIALVLEQMLCRVRRWFVDAGVDHVVLKGPAVAHTLYPDPSWRDFGDIDLLVPAEQLGRAVRVLQRQGARRQSAELAPGWDRHFAKSVTLTDGSGYEIDLHRTIAPGVFGLRIDPTRLLAATRPFVVGGRTLRALSPEGQLLQACIHTAAGNRVVWLSSVCDIVQLTRSGRVDIDRFQEMTRRWDLAAVVDRAVTVAAERLDGADVSPLVAGLRVDAADRRRLERYGDGFSGPALTGFVALPLRQWLPYGRALLWPSKANLGDRVLTRPAHLRRLTTHLTRRRPTL